jgi:hypothetical protein
VRKTAAVLLIALAAGCGGSAGHKLSDNQIVLSRSDSLRLLRWASRFQACMVRRNVAVGPPEASSKQIAMTLRPGRIPRRVVLRKGIACGEGLGDPPSDSSLQVFAHEIVLYLPKRCLLDPRVATA